jgi:hypothetical protein
MKKHYKTGGEGYFAPTHTTTIIKDYREHKLSQGIVLIPPNLNIVSRNTLIGIIRDQAELIKRLKQGV